MTSRIRTAFASLLLLAGSVAASADIIIFETFTGYPDNALISADPAGPARGLEGNWMLDAENDFYVNRTQLDEEAGTGQAVYDRPSGDNGGREATRSTDEPHVLFAKGGDVAYAAFRARTLRPMGDMLFSLMLEQLDGGGQLDISFGMINGQFVVGNGGVDIDARGGFVEAGDMLLVLRVQYDQDAGGSGGTSTVTLWVDPVDENSEPVIAQASVDLLNRGGARITAVSIRGEHMAGLPAYFDNLLVATTFEEIVFLDKNSFLRNDAGVNGLFFDLASPGHGFTFNLHETGFTILYFGHTVSGERLWLISESHLEDLEFGVSIELEMFEVVDGVFGVPMLPETFWGIVTLNFWDCDYAHASLDGLDGSLQMHLMRLTRLPGIGCQ